MDNSNKRLDEVALDIDSHLALVEDYLNHCVGGDAGHHDGAYYQGLVLSVECARCNARALYEALCDISPSVPEQSPTVCAR